MASEFDSMIAKMLASKEFFPSKERRALFNYLWANRDRLSPSIDIWEGALHSVSRSKDKDDANYDYDNSVRQSCQTLKRQLDKYFAGTSRGYYFHLPPAERGEGYRLEIIRLDDPDSPTLAFWRPHIEQKNVTLIYPQPMVYLDVQTGGYMRFLDTNPKHHTRDAALDEIEKRHPEELAKLCGTEVRERLRPMHMYVSVGDMAALDSLADWFHVYPFMTVRKQPSHSITSLKGISPVLIGTPRANRLIETLMHSEEAHHLRYRHHTTLGHVAVRDATAQEKEVLKGFSVYEENGCTVIPVAPMALSAVRRRLIIVARMPKPGGAGAVTIISSDTSQAMEPMAVALTLEAGQRSDKKPQMPLILKAFGWPERPLPASFEMIFSVKIAPGGFDMKPRPRSY